MSGVKFHKTLNRWVVATRVRGEAVYFSRVVMEDAIGRPLRPDEIVHHRNGDTTDDRAENLEVTTREAHARIHARKLNAEKAAAIRARSADSSDVLAAEFGVCRRTINQVRAGERWAA